MYYLSHLFLCWAWLLLLPQPPQQMNAITSSDAKRHVGERARVCGVVASIYEPRRSKRNPTMLNFDQPYPQTEFTAIIWQQHRPAFGDVRALVKQRVCVTGWVRAYRGRAQMTLQTSEQMSRHE